MTILDIFYELGDKFQSLSLGPLSRAFLTRPTVQFKLNVIVTVAFFEKAKLLCVHRKTPFYLAIPLEALQRCGIFEGGNASPMAPEAVALSI